jgi:hypothetical protein
MPLVLPPMTAPRDLCDRIASLRRRSRSLIAWQGALTLAAFLLGGVLLVGLLDCYLDLPAILRAGILVATLLGVAFFVQRRIVRPWADCSDDLVLALRVEDRFPGLNDALASAVEFDAEPKQGSTALRAATRRHAAREAADCDFNELLHFRPLARAAIGSVVLGLVAIILMFQTPDKGRIAIARLADPFGDHAWPPETQMTIVAPQWLARGDPFMLRGELRGIVPDVVEFRWAIDGAPASLQAIPVTSDEEMGTFGVRLDPNRVPRTFRYQVRANDSTTPWRTVPVLLPPALVDRDGRPSPQVRLAYPVYTDLPPEDLPAGGSSIECITGAAAFVRAAADRPIRRAWMELEPDSPARASSALAALGALHPMDAMARLAGGLAVVQPLFATIESESTRFELRIVPSVSGRYHLRFEDPSGLAGRREFEIRLAADPSPTVHLERPSAGRDSLAVLPNATIPLAARVEDPIFAVRSVWLEYRASAESRPERLPLANAPTSPDDSPDRQRPRHVQIERPWELQSVHHRDGRPLQDGDIVTLLVAANDFDDVTTTKPPGRSHEVELRIVSPAALRILVQKTQAEIQRELAALHTMQRDAHERAATANDQRRQSGSLRPEDLERLSQSTQLQQLIRQRIGNPREGLRAVVEALRQTLQSNPLPDVVSERSRTDALTTELERLVQEELEPIEPLLATARTERGPISPEIRQSGPLPSATRLQAEAERTLRELSERMQAWSEARELRAEAALIERDQERVARQREQFESQPGVRGADVNRLTPGLQEALARLSERQSAVADRGNELVQKLNQRAAEKRGAQQSKDAEAEKLQSQSAQGEPSATARLRSQAEEARDAARELGEQAQALAKARDTAQGSPSLATQMQSAMRALESNKMGDALATQQAVTQTLRRVQDALAETPEHNVERLAKRLERVEKAVNDLADEQEHLQKRAVEARALTDPAQRQAALEKLTREQEQLREQADELAQRLSRLRQDNAAQQLRRAARSMDQARDDIEQGLPAEAKQDDALDRLDEAQEQIEQARKELEGQLQREQRVKMMDALKGFAARQDSLGAESERIFQAARTEKSWNRALQKSLIDLGQVQQSLGGELGRFADSNFADAKVAMHMLRQASGAMNQIAPAVESVRNGPMDLDSWEDDRRIVQTPQQLAALRLKQIGDSLREADNGEPAEKALPRSKSGDANGAFGDAIPEILQLQLLRMLQAELNERTASFARLHPDAEKWTPAERAELAVLQRAQADLAALWESLTPAESPPTDRKEEKK